MAATPKYIRRQRKAEGWYKKNVSRFANPAPRVAPKTPPAEANLLSRQQERLHGEVRLTYYPTPSINPPDPRTVAAGYDEETGTMRVEWGDGGVGYYYYDVPPRVWRNFQRVQSPGRFINRVLNSYRYGPIT